MVVDHCGFESRPLRLALLWGIGLDLCLISKGSIYIDIINGNSAMCKSSKTKSESDLPYPDTEVSPHLQRTIQRKIESGEDTGVDRDEFFKLLGRIDK